MEYYVLVRYGGAGLSPFPAWLQSLFTGESDHPLADQRRTLLRPQLFHGPYSCRPLANCASSRQKRAGMIGLLLNRHPLADVYGVHKD
jgi:hypothetical protein